MLICAFIRCFLLFKLSLISAFIPFCYTIILTFLLYIITGSVSVSVSKLEKSWYGGERESWKPKIKNLSIRSSFYNFLYMLSFIYSFSYTCYHSLHYIMHAFSYTCIYFFLLFMFPLICVSVLCILLFMLSLLHAYICFSYICSQSQFIFRLKNAQALMCWERQKSNLIYLILFLYSLIHNFILYFL